MSKKRSRSPSKEADCSSDETENMHEREEQAVTEEQRQSYLNQQFQSPHQALHRQQMSHKPLRPSFPGYGVPNQYQPSYPMMTPYNMYAMNHQWPGNQMKGMTISPSTITMRGNSNLPVSTGMEITNSNANMNYATVLSMHRDLHGMINRMGNCRPYPMFNPKPMIYPVKEIQLSSCTLYPPHLSHIIESKVRHPGCKTVFCGGLPEKITEEIIREVFSRCGEICTIRMGKKNFCHIRFAEEYLVDAAIKLSGYRMKIENKDDSEYSGRLHVDFAKTRDDAYDFECVQRARESEARLQQGALRTLPSLPVVHYSDYESMQLTDKLKSEDQSKVIAALNVLNTWLEREECNEKNAWNFFSLVSSGIYATKRLLNEKRDLMGEFNDTKTQMQQKMTSISLCLQDICKVFETVQKSPNILSTFSKNRKKEIETLGEKALDVLKSHSKEMVEVEIDENKKVTKEDLLRLKTEMDDLHKKYDIALHENESAKKERARNKKSYDEMSELIKGRIATNQAECKDLQKCKENYLKSQNCEKQSEETFLSNDINNFSITQHEILLIISISTFLNVHPFGASIDYICSYLCKLDKNITRSSTEHLLKKFPNLFKEHSSGVGATLLKTWKFVGFNT